jgi:hypothetical protein
MVKGLLQKSKPPAGGEQILATKPSPPTISMRNQFANRIQAKRPLPLGSLSRNNVPAKWWGVLDAVAHQNFWLISSKEYV